MLVFEERGKPEYPEKNLSEQSREPTNSTHIWRRVRESNPGHIGGRQALSPLRQLCSPQLCSPSGRSSEIELIERVSERKQKKQRRAERKLGKTPFGPLALSSLPRHDTRLTWKRQKPAELIETGCTRVEPREWNKHQVRFAGCGRMEAGWRQDGGRMADMVTRVRIPLWPLAGVALGKFLVNSSVILVNSQLVCLPPVLTLLFLFALFVSLFLKSPLGKCSIKYLLLLLLFDARFFDFSTF